MAQVRKRVGIDAEHQVWLENHPGFNFSQFVRNKLDEEIDEE